MLVRHHNTLHSLLILFMPCHRLPIKTIRRQQLLMSCDPMALLLLQLRNDCCKTGKHTVKCILKSYSIS